MAAFRYRALTMAGRTVRGALSAADEVELFHRLRQMGLELVDARAQDQGGLLSRITSRPIKNRDLIEMCLHLGQLEKVGVPILDSLTDVRETTDSARLRDVLSEVTRDISDGQLLSQALARHPAIFGPVFIGLVAAGERTGKLADAFAHLVEHLKWMDHMRRRVLRALRYPAFILLLSVVMIGALLTQLVPHLAGFLTTLGRDLPAVTRNLLATSGFVTRYWWLLAALLIGTPIMLLTLRRSGGEIGRQIDRILLRIPALGGIMRKLSLARFAHFFALMYQAGIPILQCIDGGRRVVGNQWLQSILDEVRRDVEGGSTLTMALRRSGEFPSMVLRMVKIGEDTGNLSETLTHVGYFYDRDVDDQVQAIVGSLQPALTVLVGAVMAWIIVATLGPVYSSFQAIR